MWIDFDDEESKPILIEITDNEEKQTEKQTIIIPTLDLYNKGVGDDTGNKQVTTFSYN